MFVAQPGLIVGNRYSLTHVIGRGGMGEVWKAHDRELDTACAVKFILQHLANDRGIRERFAREAKAVARLRSPHVVHILGVGEIDNVPYLAMELLDGETLLARLERIGRMHPAVTLKMLEQVAEALESAHQAGIVHRDLKPDNVWFWSGNKVFVKVLDFGVAKTAMTTESLQTATGALVGTPQYMSPEQALGNRDIDHRSDLWSLAVIAMECLSGRRPFESAGLGDLLMKIVGAAPPPVRELASDLPAGLQEWWSKALARDPRDRFQSATELVDALRPCLSPFEQDAHGAESARSARMPVPERPVLELALSEHGAGSGLAGGRLRSHGSSDASLPARTVPARSVPARSVPARSVPARSVPARSVPHGAVDSLAAESAPPRVPGSVGPISSSRAVQQRRDSRQRTVLIAGGLLAAAVLATLGRLFLAAAPAEDAAARAPTPPAQNSPGAVLADPAPAGPAAVEPAVAAAAGPAPALVSGERPPLGQPSPWEVAMRGNKAAEPATATQALQPPADNPAEPRIKPVSAPPVPAATAATPADSVGLGAKPAGSPKALSKPPEAVRPPSEATHPEPPPRNAAGESEAARKERLRKATGL